MKEFSNSFRLLCMSCGFTYGAINPYFGILVIMMTEKFNIGPDYSNIIYIVSLTITAFFFIIAGKIVD